VDAFWLFFFLEAAPNSNSRTYCLAHHSRHEKPFHDGDHFQTTDIKSFVSYDSKPDADEVEKQARFDEKVYSRS
jgi:hypothetical protein